MAARATKRNARGRFERCVAEVSERPGVASPRGVCAAAGRRKYGAKKFAAMAVAGRKRAATKKNFFGLGRKLKKAKSRLGTGYGVVDGDGYPVHTGPNDLTKREALKIAKEARAAGEKGIRLVRGNRGTRKNWSLPKGVLPPGKYDYNKTYDENYPKKRKAKRSRRRKKGAPGWLGNKGKKKPARRKNPLDAARDVYRKFHGRDADKVLEVTEPMHVHKYLSGIGDLVGLQILTNDGRAKVTLKFDDGTVLAQNEKRNQLFIRGGDQSVDLKDFGITGPHHELEILGEVVWVSYYTRKDHLAPEDGGEAVYKHRFGRKKPTLIYDAVNKKMELAGGGYDIPDEGIDQ